MADPLLLDPDAVRALTAECVEVAIQGPSLSVPDFLEAERAAQALELIAQSIRSSGRRVKGTVQISWEVPAPSAREPRS